MDDNKLMWLLKTGELEEIRTLLTTTDDVNQDVRGRTPLHYAADFGHKDVMEYLISKGADVNASDKYGLTPLMCACYENHVTCVKFLREKGADKDRKAPDGKSAYECADNKEMKDACK